MRVQKYINLNLECMLNSSNTNNLWNNNIFNVLQLFHTLLLVFFIYNILICRSSLFILLTSILKEKYCRILILASRNYTSWTSTISPVFRNKRSTVSKSLILKKKCYCTFLGHFPCNKFWRKFWFDIHVSMNKLLPEDRQQQRSKAARQVCSGGITRSVSDLQGMRVKAISRIFFDYITLIDG